MPNKGFSNHPPLQLVAGATSIDDSNSVRLDIAGRVSGGVLSLTKTLVFEVPPGANPRAYNATDVFYHPMFPETGELLAEDARMHFTGEAEISHWMDDGRLVTVDLTYSSPDLSFSHDEDSDGDSNTDVDGNEVTKDTPPWKLRPQEVRYAPITRELPVTYTYDDEGRLFDDEGRALRRTLNSAGYPMNITKKFFHRQISFTYYLKDINMPGVEACLDSINKDDIKICGRTYKAGTLLLANMATTKLTTRDQKQGNRKKWSYWKLDATIEFDPFRQTFAKTVLDVGDRARFPVLENFASFDILFYKLQYSIGVITIPAADPTPQQIVRFYPFIEAPSSYAPNSDWKTVVPDFLHPIICGKQQFLYYTQVWQNYASAMRFNVPDMRAEDMHDMPLTAEGFFDYDAMTTGLYRTKRFNVHPVLSWNCLELPRKA